MLRLLHTIPKNVAVLGYGPQKQSLIKFLNTNFWQKNGVWYACYMQTNLFTREITPQTNLGIVFCEVEPKRAEELYVKPLEEQGKAYVRVWPDYVGSRKFARNIYLPSEPFWPKVLKELGVEYFNHEKDKYVV